MWDLRKVEKDKLSGTYFDKGWGRPLVNLPIGLDSLHVLRLIYTHLIASNSAKKYRMPSVI